MSFEIFFLLIMIPAMALSLFLGIKLSDKMLSKMPCIIGFRKKNRFIIHDERLKSLYWKARNWGTLIFLVLFIAAVILVTEPARGNVLIILVISGAAAISSIFCAVMHRKRRKDFNKMKDELGIELERYDDTDKAKNKEITDKTMKTLRPLIIFMIVMLIIMSVRYFMQDKYIQGIIFAVIAVSNLITWIIIVIKKELKK